MHYLALVVIPPARDVDISVAKAMAPFREEFLEKDESLEGFWDWFQIGGRWTGHLDGYDPEKDPDNVDPRGWHRDENGLSLKWPTDWKRHPGDVQLATAVVDLLERDDDKFPYTFVANGEGLERERFVGDGFVETPDFNQRVLETLRALPEGSRVVVVDYHS